LTYIVLFNIILLNVFDGEFHPKNAGLYFIQDYFNLSHCYKLYIAIGESIMKISKSGLRSGKLFPLIVVFVFLFFSTAVRMVNTVQAQEGEPPPQGVYLPFLAFSSPGWNHLTSVTSQATLLNGVDISVSIDEPLSSTEFLIPPPETSIEAEVNGSASIGEGEPDTTLIYVFDVSGSTIRSSGGDCGGDLNNDLIDNTVLDCEVAAVLTINAAAISANAADEVGIAGYGGDGFTADMLPGGGPDDPISAPDADSNVETVATSVFAGGIDSVCGIGQFTTKTVGCNTNFAAGLAAIQPILTASTNSTNIIFFLSDGISNTGTPADFDAALMDIVDSGAVIHSFAVGDMSTCTGGSAGTLDEMASATGGECHQVTVPSDLPDLLPEFVGSMLESLEIEVDGGGSTAIGNDEIDPDLPQEGPVSVDYSTTVSDLEPGNHVICVTATGSDVSGPVEATACETIHVYAIELDPPSATNELSSDNSHQVAFTLIGDHDLAGRMVDFEVGGQNAGASGVCSPNPDCTTDVSGQVSFEYEVPVEVDSLGEDTISAAITLHDPRGETGTLEVTKQWVDTTPPVSDCIETVNPHGDQIPPADNEDGFFEILAEDNLDTNPQVFVVDDGSGVVFGPFSSQTKIKYTQAPGATPTIKPMAGPNSAVDWHIKGQGDAAVFSVDSSGNTSESVSCLVPPPPK
jgi:hypothetical protein